MQKLLIALTILCVFDTGLVKGIDNQAPVAAFMSKLNDCKAEVGAKDVDVEELVNAKPASSMEGKCLRLCLLIKYEVMDNNGKFVKTMAISHAKIYTGGAEDEMKIAHKIIDACADIEVATDHCEAGDQYGKCIMEQSDAHGFRDILGF